MQFYSALQTILDRLLFDSRLYVGLVGIVLGPDTHESPYRHPNPNFTYLSYLSRTSNPIIEVYKVQDK